MRETTKRSVLVLWALLLIVSELHSTHAQLHSRMGGWSPGGKKRSFPLLSQDRTKQWTHNQRKSSYSTNQDSLMSSLIYNIAKSLARRISTQGLKSQQQSLEMFTPKSFSGSIPYEDERRRWQWDEHF